MEGADKLTAKAEMYVYSVPGPRIFDNVLVRNGKFYATYQAAYEKHKELHANQSIKPPIIRYIIPKNTQYERDGVMIQCNIVYFNQAIYDI